MQRAWSQTHWQDSAVCFFPAVRAALLARTVTRAPIHLPSPKHKKCMDNSHSNVKLIPLKQEDGSAGQAWLQLSQHQHIPAIPAGRSSVTPQWAVHKWGRLLNALCLRRSLQTETALYCLQKCMIPTGDEDNRRKRSGLWQVTQPQTVCLCKSLSGILIDLTMIRLCFCDIT